MPFHYYLKIDVLSLERLFIIYSIFLKFIFFTLTPFINPGK